jgi:hypothetical protein
MRSVILFFFCSSIIIFNRPVVGQDNPDIIIDELRSALEQLRQEYDTRIQILEQRLSLAESQVRQAQQVQQVTTIGDDTVNMRSGNSAFNPAIGVIFEGLAWDYQNNPDDYLIGGLPLGGEAGPAPQGLSLGETEIDISANVDDKFTAWLTTPLVIEEGEVAIEIEEAWIETTALPAGLSARFGRFFSSIGYLNEKHAHSWDFADQPLVYQALLGNQYIDDGLQFRWLAPTDLYLELGGELLRGDRYPAGGATDSGFGAYSLFARVGGDVGTSHSWLAGISYLSAGSSERPSGDEDDPLLFTGDTDLFIADFIWKWSPQGNWRERNVIFQFEYLQRQEQGEYTLPGELVLPYDVDHEGFYVQAVYQPFPRWRIGVRYDWLSPDNPGALFTGTDLDPARHNPERYTFMVDWSNSEFSRIRFQVAQDETIPDSETQFGVQYIHSIGAHGAHSF